MYTFVRSYVKKLHQWSEVDVSGETIASLRSNYDNVKLILTQPPETALLGFLFNENKGILNSIDNSLTVTAWINTINKDQVRYNNKAVDFNGVKSLKHRNLYDMPIKVTSGNINYGEGQPIPRGLDKDIVFTSSADEATELSTMNIAKNMVFAVNGYFMQSIYQDGRGFIIDAKDKVRDLNSSVVTAIDFTDLGGLTQINITEDSVTVPVPSATDVQLNRARAIFTHEGIPDNSTPILVLDGNLHILDNTIKRIGAKEYLITLDIESILKRASKRKNANHTFVDSANYRGYGIDASSFNTKAFLHQTDSFILFVHTNELCIFKEKLTNTNLYGAYEHYRVPKGIIVNEVSEYMPHLHEEASEKHYSLLVMDNVRKMHFFDTVKFNPMMKFSDNTMSSRERQYQDAYVLELYTF